MLALPSISNASSLATEPRKPNKHSTYQRVLCNALELAKQGKKFTQDSLFEEAIHSYKHAIELLEDLIEINTFKQTTVKTLYENKLIHLKSLINVPDLSDSPDYSCFTEASLNFSQAELSNLKISTAIDQDLLVIKQGAIPINHYYEFDNNESLCLESFNTSKPSSIHLKGMVDCANSIDVDSEQKADRTKLLKHKEAFKKLSCKKNSKNSHRHSSPLDLNKRAFRPLSSDALKNAVTSKPAKRNTTMLKLTEKSIPSLPSHNSGVFSLMGIMANVISKGGYVTKSLYVPKTVWSQGYENLNEVELKTTTCVFLTGYLKEIEKAKASDSQKVYECVEDLYCSIYGIDVQIHKRLLAGTGSKYASRIKTIGNKIFKKITKKLISEKHESTSNLSYKYADCAYEFFVKVQLLNNLKEHYLKKKDVCSRDKMIIQRIEKIEVFYMNVVYAFVLNDTRLLLQSYCKKSQKQMPI